MDYTTKLRWRLAAIIFWGLVSAGLVLFAAIAGLSGEYDKGTFCLLLGWLVHINTNGLPTTPRETP